MLANNTEYNALFNDTASLDVSSHYLSVIEILKNDTRTNVR